MHLSMNPLSTRALRSAIDGTLHGIDAMTTPQAGPPLDAPPVPTRDDALRRGALILVAEDNPVNWHLIQSQLRLLGCVCDVVDDGAQALLAYDAGSYAILLTDCQMPRMNGYELAAHIRTREHSARLDAMPIVGVTASIEAGETGQCTDAGMNDCIRKPASLDVAALDFREMEMGAGVPERRTRAIAGDAAGA